MGTILAFPPRRKRRRAAALPLFPVSIQVFPLASELRVVSAIAQEMIEKADINDAEAVLVAHLELEVLRLIRIGVDDEHIERVCRDFAVAVWQLVRPSETEVFA